VARKLLEKLTDRYVESLKPGEIVTTYDLQQYCIEQHKNLGVHPISCTRQLKRHPQLEPIDKNKFRKKRR